MSLSIPSDHPTLRSIKFSKTKDPLSQSNNGEIWIVFKTSEALKQFDLNQKMKGPCSTYSEERRELRITFFDPKEDQHKNIDMAIQNLAKHFGIVPKSEKS